MVILRSHEEVVFKLIQGTEEEANCELTSYSEKRVSKYNFTPSSPWPSSLGCIPTCLCSISAGTGLSDCSHPTTLICRANLSTSSLRPFIWCLSQLYFWPLYLWRIPLNCCFPYLWDTFSPISIQNKTKMKKFLHLPSINNLLTFLS